jgi:hypothetical protein
MKYFFSGITFLIVFFGYAQKPCDFSTNVVDSLGSYKTTKEYLLYEKNFAGNSTYLFASFVLADDKPLFNLQLIEKSADFIKVKCFDKNSKVYVQLNNNKIVTLSFVNEESCGTLLRDDKGLNNRILTGYFSISNLDYAELKKSAVSFIRIKFSTDVSDYIFKREFKSELNSEVYEPESYFINYLHCLEAKN